MVEEIIAFYNVENFYPSDENSLETQHSGLYNWDDYKYNLKVRKIIQVFRFIEEDYGQLPSIIGLAEIGDISVLKDLTKEDSPLKGYEIVYQQSNDSRRLSVALLFDKKKYSLIKVDFLKFKMDENIDFDTRDILHTELLLGKKKVHIFVVHLPSQRNHDVKKEMRDYILTKLKQTIQELSDKKETLILMGDFNDDPNSQSIQELMFDENGKKLLTNPFEALHKNRKFSTFHRKQGVTFDQILYTEHYLRETSQYKTITAEIYNSPRLTNKNRKNNNYPTRTYSGSRYMGGWSDHFPVILKLN